MEDPRIRHQADMCGRLQERHGGDQAPRLRLRRAGRLQKMRRIASTKPTPAASLRESVRAVALLRCFGPLIFIPPDRFRSPIYFCLGIKRQCQLVLG